MSLPRSRSLPPLSVPLSICCSLVFAALLSLSAARRSFADAQNPTLAPADPKSVISFLNLSIAWYRNFPAEQQLATDSNDASYLDDDRKLSEQIVHLSFDFALADADLLSRQASPVNPANAQSDTSTQSTYRNTADMAAQADQQVAELEGEIALFKQQRTSASGAALARIESAIAETQSELDLAVTRRDVLRNMVQFVGGIDSGGKGATNFRAQIQELQRAVPAANPPSGSSSTNPPSGPAPPPVAVYPPRKSTPTGIFGLITDLFSLRRKIAALDDSIQLCASLAAASRSLNAPLNATLQEFAKRGDTLAVQADTSNASDLLQEKSALDALNLEFKRASDAAMPLDKQSILLDLYKSNLTNWRSSVQIQYSSEFRTLLYNLLTLSLFITAALLVSEFWRRAIFRYVREPRRRYQFLLLRRIAMWLLIAVVIAFAFASQLGSLATFAGLLTAGVAFALQNVILSFVGYFFLIGKYGVRVGDRVQIASVTGEVVDIGLIRIHLAELSSAESDAQPTGRTVGFSNSVVFEAGKGFFKQIPDTSFVWHQITLILAPESNYKKVEERLMGAVNSVFAEYKDAMELQRARLERSFTSMSVKSFEPQSRLHLTQTGLEVVIRYPLDLEKASDVDDRITRSLLDAIDREPKLKLVGTGTPNLQPIIPVPTASPSPPTPSQP